MHTSTQFHGEYSERFKSLSCVLTEYFFDCWVLAYPEITGSQKHVDSAEFYLLNQQNSQQEANQRKAHNQLIFLQLQFSKDTGALGGKQVTQMLNPEETCMAGLHAASVTANYCFL